MNINSQSFGESNLSYQETLKNKRFVNICDRQDRSDIPPSAWRPLTDKYYLQTWKGIQMDKSPLEIALYPMLIGELRPKTIIEIGAEAGGSAIWLADNLELLGSKGNVYSVDIDLSLLDERAKANPKVNFLAGDCNHIEAVLSAELLSKLVHPWLIIEDAHINLVGVLDYFHNHGLQSGDYLIVEDTNKDLWESWSDWEDQEFIERMKSKMGLLRSWLIEHQNGYMIDTYYQDMFGYNGSKNWNSILKKS